MRCSPGPVQTWCLLACLSSERTLLVCSVLRFPCCLEAASDWSLSLAEVHNFGGLGMGRRGTGGDGSGTYAEQIVTVTPLDCLTATLEEEGKQVMEVRCRSRLVVQPVFSITVADVSTQTSYDLIQGQTFS